MRDEFASKTILAVTVTGRLLLCSGLMVFALTWLPTRKPAERTLFGPELVVWGVPMSNSKELSERARMFEERADKATDPISRQHYREMAIHYRSLSVEHRQVARQSELEHPPA
jgi:hypothetical protein